MPQVDFGGGGGSRRRGDDAFVVPGPYEQQPLTTPAAPRVGYTNPAAPQPLPAGSAFAAPPTPPPGSAGAQLSTQFANNPDYEYVPGFGYRYKGYNPATGAVTGRPNVSIDPKSGSVTGPNLAGPQNGNFQAWFNSLVAGKAASPAALASLEPVLNQYGIKINRNARGLATDITLPDGRVVDVGRSFGTNDPTQMAWQWLDGGAGNGASGPGNSNNTDLFVNEILSRMQDLRQPINDPLDPLYQLLSLARVGFLSSSSPYTAGEDAALTTHYLEPLTSARDAATQQAKEWIGARGMLPSSGLLQDAVNKINTGYERGVASGANDLAVRAVDEKQRRADEALSIMQSLLTDSRATRSEDDARARELLQTAGLLPQLDRDTLNSLLAASGEGSVSPSSEASLLLGLGNQNLTAQQIANQNTQARNAAFGQYFGYLLNNWDKIQGLFG